MIRAATLCLMLALTGCVTTEGDFCKIAKAEHPSADEIAHMSIERKREILKTNLKGEKLCGWTQT